ncbi:MAG: hypothetical protein QNK37_21095 [Acidobacteriota bacterium]|nr:hypothetical protein [Acidobacteriota bacterium]
MARIDGVDPKAANGYIGKVLKAQEEVWGGPLLNHLLYARRPALFKAVRGMWSGLNKDGPLPETLVALINRRVAAHNGCVF